MQASNIAVVLPLVLDPSVIGFQYVPLIRATSYFFCPLFLNSFKLKNIHLLSWSSSQYWKQKHLPLTTVKQLVRQPKTSTSSHGQADSTPTTNIYLFSGQGDSTPTKNIYPFSRPSSWYSSQKHLPVLRSSS